MPDGLLLLFYKVGPDPASWWGMLRRSEDGGRSWSAARRLPDGIWGPIKNKPVLLKDDTLLCPTSSEATGWQVFLQMTSDLGETWQTVGPLNEASQIAAIQPTIVTWPSGDLQLLCRTRQGFISSCRSVDGGRSWRPMRLTLLPNPNSGIDACTLRDGRALLVYNHTGLVAGRWGGPRSPLNVAVSDDGRTWSAAAVLEDDPGEFSYPAVIQSADGYVHIAYTWKRENVRYVAFDPASLEPVPMPDGLWPENLDVRPDSEGRGSPGIGRPYGPPDCLPATQ
jgi:predicted neuraminidase